MKLWSHFANDNNLKRTASAMLAGLTLLFAVQAWASDPIPVTTCGTVISTPGAYQLVNDLVNCPQDGIDIVSSDVHLILNGHQISGSGSGNGIAVGVGIPAPGVSGVQINGPASISSFGAGVVFEGVSASAVLGVTSTGNKFGFAVNASFTADGGNLHSVGNKFNGNTATANAAHGFTLNGADQNTFRGNDSSGNGVVFAAQGFFLFAATGNVVQGNTFDQNSRDGVLAQATTGINNTIRGNTVQGNGSFDLEDDNSGCANVWQGNTFGSANQPCIQ